MQTMRLSPLGCVQSFYRKTVRTWRRQPTKDELSSNPKLKNNRVLDKKTMILGPFVRRDLVRSDEVAAITALNNEIFSRVKKFPTYETRGGKITSYREDVKKFVDNAYGAVNPLNAVLRERRQAIRTRALVLANGDKLTPEVWNNAKNELLPKAVSLNKVMCDLAQYPISDKKIKLDVLVKEYLQSVSNRPLLEAPAEEFLEDFEISLEEAKDQTKV
jgi:hypothetical protein